MPGRRRKATIVGLIASPILFVMAIAMVIQSSRALVLLAGSADIRDLAAAIEAGGALPEADYLAVFVESNGLGGPGSDCGNLSTRASLTVTLAALEAAIGKNDLALIDSAQKDALAVIKHRLACNPLDGNAWLRHAMVDERGSGPIPRVVDALRWSYWSAPNEAWIMEARLPFATRLFRAGVTGFEAEYLGDLRRFAAYEPARQVARTYVETAPRIRTFLHPMIAAQPAERKKAMVAEIDRLGMVFER